MFALATAFQVIGDYDGGGHMDWGGGWWIVMVIAMFLFWGLVAYWLVRAFGTRNDQRGAVVSDDALTILDRRLAEGLITPDEYRERKAILTGVEPNEPDSN